MNKYTRLGKNIVLVFMGNAGAKLIGLLMLPFYTRWLSVEDYGTTDIINVYVTLLLDLTTVAIAQGIFVFTKDQNIEKKRSYFSSGLCFAFFLFLVTALVFQIISIICEYKKISTYIIANIWFIYSLIVTTFLQQYIQNFVRGIDKIKVYCTTGIIVTSSTALFSFVLIPKWKIMGYILSLILANVIAAIYSFLFSNLFKYLKISAFKKETCKEMIKYSIFLVPSGIAMWFIRSMNRPLMETILGLHSVGIFAVANRFPGIVHTLFFGIFAPSWQISVLEEFKKQGYAEFYNRIFRLITVGLILLFFIITALCETIITIMTTSAFYEASQYIPILLLGMVFYSISNFTGSNFMATHESKYSFYVSISGGLTSILFNFIFIPIFGIIGAAISMTVSYMVMAIIHIAFAWKYVRIYNVTTYIIMFALCIIDIIITLCIKPVLFKYGLSILLFIIFLSLNYKIKEDIYSMFRIIMSKLTQNKALICKRKP